MSSPFPFRIGLLFLSISLAACSGKEAEAPATPPPYVPPVMVETADIPDVRYATRELPFRHTHGGSGKRYMPEPMGPGTALFDYDGDGDLDIFLSDGREFDGEPRIDARQTLLRNDGNLSFTDVSEEAGAALHIYGQGACAADYDGDGDTDLFLTAVDGQRLLRNDGGRFKDVTEAAGLKAATWTDAQGREHPEWSTAAVWLDYDGDEKLDLFVGNYVRWSVENDLFTTIDGTSKSFTTPEKYQGLSNRLYRNLGKGKFEDVTKAAGVFNPSGKTLGVAVADVNDDGKPDLVVANDTQPNYLYVNQGGSFVDRAQAAGVAFDESGRARAGMGVDVVDLNNDGHAVIAIGNFSKEPISLFAAGDGGFFTDRSGAMRLTRPSLLPLTFAVLFEDYDLDGRLDLLAANGHLEPEIERLSEEIRYKQAPQLFRNTGDRFVEAGKKAGDIFGTELVARGLAVGDLDGDGDRDLVLTVNGGTALVLEHLGARNAWLRVRLKQPGANPDALGARVRLSAGELTQTRWVRTGSSYLSQSELTRSFGLGEHQGPVTLTIRWPDGAEETREIPQINREVLIERGTQAAAP